MKNKNIYYCALLCVSAFMILIFSHTTSPLFPAPSLDSHIFQQIGLAILKGKLPYTDIFDHKGPYVFFHQALGLFINRNWGIAFLQILSLFVTSVYLSKAIQLITNSLVVSCICMALFYFSLFVYEFGNTVEDMSLPFIAFPLYAILKSMVQDKGKISLSLLFSIGICIGIVCFIRPNNIFPVLGALFFLLYINIKNKDFNYCLQGALSSVGGFVIAVMPCFIFFYFSKGKHGVEDMMYGSFYANFEYMQKSGDSWDIPFAIKSFAPIAVMLLLTATGLKRYPKLSISIILAYIFGSIVIGKLLYRHYFIVLSPLIPLTIALLMQNNKRLIYMSLCIVTLLVSSINPIYRSFDFFRRKQWEDCIERRKQFVECVEKVIPNDERDRIWNYDAAEELDLFMAIDAVQCNRIILENHPHLFDDVASERGSLNRIRPKYILCRKDASISNIDDKIFIQDHYRRVDSTSVPSLENIVLLKLKSE